MSREFVTECVRIMIPPPVVTSLMSPLPPTFAICAENSGCATHVAPDVPQSRRRVRASHGVPALDAQLVTS